MRWVIDDSFAGFNQLRKRLFIQRIECNYVSDGFYNFSSGCLSQKKGSILIRKSSLCLGMMIGNDELLTSAILFQQEITCVNEYTHVLGYAIELQEFPFDKGLLTTFSCSLSLSLCSYFVYITNIPSVIQFLLLDVI